MINLKIEVPISSEFITLGQFLQYENIIESGGTVKLFLQEVTVYVNGEQDQRRGRKLYPSDQVQIENIGEFIIVTE